MSATKSNTSAPFESLNARFLEPWEVARSFVPPPHFDHVVKKRHTILVGPRGSGKTTLLKMLQGAALEAWLGETADKYRTRVDYTGVFVPYDRSWQSQISNLGSRRLDPLSRQVFGTAAFTTQILSALIDAIRYRVEKPERERLHLHRRVTLTREIEVQFAQAVASAWLLTLTVPSFWGLTMALADRRSAIGRLANTEGLRTADGREERLAAERYLHLDFLASALVAVQAFEETSNERGARWAFLFDELELAPEWIRRTLLQALRSVDQRLLFKLSLSVYAPDLAQSAATQRDDMDLIRLWYPHKEEGYPFCEALLNSMLESRGFFGLRPVDVLGRSVFDPPLPRQAGSAYAEGSPLQHTYSELAARDPSFASFVRHKGFDLSAMEKLPAAQRADTVRKIRAIVIAREAFRTESTGPGARSSAGRRRSRKNPQIYSGASSLFAISEGNPRLFIGVIDRLIGDLRARGSIVPRPRQSSEVHRAAALFRAYLRTIPCPPFTGAQPTRGVLSLIRHVGKSFAHELLDVPFNPEPPGSFVVDSWASELVLRSLADALDAGAIVYVPDDAGETVLASLRGKRFRLSYLLAAQFKLPLVLLRAVPLSAVLPGMQRSRPEAERQESLFATEDEG